MLDLISLYLHLSWFVFVDDFFVFVLFWIQDSTLVCPKGKNKFPKGRSDWKWQFASVPSKLKSLYNEENFRLVIFTNQGGIGTGKQRASDIYGKIIDLSNALGLPLTALISTQKDKNRKPNTFMFDYFIEHLHKSGGAANGSNSNNSSSSSSEKTKKDAGDEKGDGIDWENSFYCGDAAGRPAAWNGDKKTKKDFSVSDRKFAANVGIKFCTPEPLFLRHKEYANFDWRAMDPKEYLKQNPEENYEKTETWFHGKLPVAKKDVCISLTSFFLSLSLSLSLCLCVCMCVCLCVCLHVWSALLKESC